MISNVLAGISLGLSSGGVGLSAIGAYRMAGLFMLAAGLVAVLSIMTYKEKGSDGNRER